MTHIPNGRRWSPDEDNKLVALRRLGTPNAIIAEQMGRTKKSVVARLNALGVKKPLEGRMRANGCIVEVPAWVPAGLRDDYKEVARLDGEHAAAAWARAEKRSMAA